MSNIHADYTVATHTDVIPVYLKYDSGAFGPYSIIVKKGDEENEIHISCWDQSLSEVFAEYNKLVKNGNIGKQERFNGKLIK